MTYSIEFMAQFVNDNASFPTLTYTPELLTGNIYLNLLPKSDVKPECVGLFEAPGDDSRLMVYDAPDKYIAENIKLIYRGSSDKLIDAWKIAKELYDALRTKANWSNYGNAARRVFKVNSMGMASMGLDENGYPEFVMKFRLQIIVQ